MGLNVNDACEWLQTSPVIDEITATIIKLKLRLNKPDLEPTQKQTLEHVIQILESAESDLSSGDTIQSYKDLLESFKIQGFNYQPADITNEDFHVSENCEYQFDPSPLVDHTSVDNSNPLSGEEKQARLKEIRAMLSKGSMVNSAH